MNIRDIYKIIGALFFMLFAVSCDLLRTAEQDVSAVISPDAKPNVTYTASISGDVVKEGDKFIYTITTDRPIDRPITFTPNQIGGTAGEEDYEASPTVLEPYTTEVKMVIAFIADGFPEVEETLKLEIGVYGIADRYLINPNVLNPVTIDLKIANVNNPAALTLAMEWDDQDMDYDFVIWSDTPDYPMEEWGDEGASGDNPEIDKSIVLDDPMGTYYVSIMDWDDGPFDYKFSIGHPNGKVEFIEGTFDRDAKEYTNDPWRAWGDPKDPEDYEDSFRVLKVEKSEAGFTVTKL